MGNSETVTRNAAWLMAQRVLMSVFSVAVVAVVARYLGTEHYGLLVLLLSYNALLLQLSSLGLRPYSVRKIAARREDAREVVEEMLTLRFVLTAVAAAGAVVYLHFGEESLPDALILVLALQLMTNATANCFIDGLYGVEDIKAVATAMGASGFVVQFASLVAVVADAGLAGIGWSYVAGSLVLLGLTWRSFGRHAGGLRMRGLRREQFSHVRASRTFFFQNLVHTIRLRLDVIFLTAILGPHATGIYGSSLTLIQRLDLIQDALTTALFPRVSSLHGKAPGELRSLVSGAFKLALVVSMPMAIGLFAVSADVVRIIFGAKFSEAAGVLAVLGLSIPFGFTYGVMFNVLTAMERQRVVFLASLIATPPAIGLMVAAILMGGVTGAAVAFVVVVTSLAVPLVVIYWRQVGPVISSRDVAGIVAANALMGGALWAIRDQHVGLKIVVAAAVYAASILALRVITPGAVRAALRSARKEG